MEMTQEREASILEGTIERIGEDGLKARMRTVARSLARGLADGDEVWIKIAVAKMGVVLNMLQIVYGDCTEEEIAYLEALEAAND